MRIAFFVSPYLRVPPESLEIGAPWYLASSLIEGLIKQGHQVTTFCAEGSSVGGEKVTAGIARDVDEKGKSSPAQFLEYSIFREQRLAAELVRKTQEGAFDVIHVYHGALRVLSLVSAIKTPVVITLHDPIKEHRRWMYELYKNFSHISYIFLTQSHAKSGEGLPIAGIVPHGIEMSDYPFAEKSGDYFLITGRIKPEKGFIDAIAAVKQAGEKLIVAGQYYKDDPESVSYWNKEIAPHIDERQIMHRGLLQQEELKQLYAGAKALLFPIDWDEPFGMVMLEAMACGTPVIAYDRASVPEIVKDGLSGFIINNSSNSSHLSYLVKKSGVDGFAEAIGRISEIDRTACRRHVEERFPMKKTTEGYEGVYRKVTS